MSERETLEVDVLFVGAGPASLAGAYHLGNLIARHNEAVAAGTHAGPALPEVQLAVIEKSAEIGDHGFSGAVLDPVALNELMPDWRERGSPLTVPVQPIFIASSSRVSAPVNTEKFISFPRAHSL